MKVKVLFNQWDNYVGLDIAKKLKEKYNWKPFYWITHEYYKKDIKKYFPNIIFHDKIDAIKGIPPDECKNIKLHCLDQEKLKELSFCETITLHMMNKMDVDGSFNYNERINLYYKYIQYWLSIIDYYKPDLFLTPVSPHVIYDYVLYNLCKIKNIKTILFFEHGLFPYIFPVNHFESDTNHIIKKYNEINSKNIILSKDMNNYIKKLNGSYNNAIPEYKKNIQKKSNIYNYILKKFLENPYIFFDKLRKNQIVKKTYLKEKNKKIEESDIHWSKILLYQFKAKKKKEQYEKYYKSVQEKPNYNEKYIYVPLHFQPERSTSPEGEIFVNQLIMIDLLSKCISDNWKLYVKENQTQFNPYRGGQYSRTMDFYHELNNNDDVKLIPTNISSFDLIDNAKATATVTGTSGWESVVRGKPTLIFGHAWYKGCEGVFYIKNEKICKEILTKINNGYSINEENVKKFVYVIEKYGTKACLGKYLENKFNIEHEENIEILSDSIYNFYKQKI